MDETQDDYEKLFLLEVLVDSLMISNSSLNIDKNLMSNFTDTCVLFQFLHYPPLVVCESDFIGTPLGHRDSSHITFKSGKSCFFSLRSPRGPILPVPFDVKVSVIRRLKEGVLPDKLEVGKTSIDMSESFTELLKQNTDENCDALPLSRNKKGIFEIRDDYGKTVGNLTAFVRLSCFGKLIITQFSLSKEDEKSYLFKGTDVNQICKSGDEKGRPCGDNGVTGAVPCVPPKEQPTPIDRRDLPREDQRGSCGQEEFGRDFRDRGYSESRYDRDRGYCQPRDSRDRDYCQTSPRGQDNYGRARPCGCPIDYSYRPPPPAPRVPTGGRSGRGNLCDCPYPVPPSVMSKYTQRTEKNLGLAPGEVGMQDDQVVFQLPLKKQGDPATDRPVDSSVYYKLTSAEETCDGQQKNTVHIKSDDLPGMAGKGAVSPVSGLPVDDGHDVFLLKIGKKCDGDKKRNLELELRTPKMKEPKPPMTDQNTQYLESDIPKPAKSSKDKGKKGKGKGKGKDKKGGKGKGKGKSKKGKKK